MPKREERAVQGAYISINAKQALHREAERQKVKPSLLATDILEKEAKKIIRKERRLWNEKD